MATKNPNQHNIYLPNPLAGQVADDVAEGRYVVRDICKLALQMAHDGTFPPQVGPPSDPEATRAQERLHEVQQLIYSAYVEVSDGQPRLEVTTNEALGQLLAIAKSAQITSSEIEVGGVVEDTTESYVVPIENTYYVPVAGEPQRMQWFSSVDVLGDWLQTAHTRGERLDSVSFDPVGNSVLALISQVAVVGTATDVDA